MKIKDLFEYQNTGLYFEKPEKCKEHEKDFFGYLNKERSTEMVSSVSSIGNLQPVLLTKDYFIISGKNRVDACKVSGKKVLAVRFLEDLPPEIIRKAIAHTNFVTRSNNDSDRKVQIYKNYREWIGKEATLSYIAKETGVSLSKIKQIHLAYRDREKFKNKEFKLTEQEISEGKKLFIKLEKILNEIRPLKREYEKNLALLKKIAPMTYWNKLRSNIKKGK